jgi:hypothetical protein
MRLIRKQREAVNCGNAKRQRDGPVPRNLSATISRPRLSLRVAESREEEEEEGGGRGGAPSERPCHFRLVALRCLVQASRSLRRVFGGRPPPLDSSLALPRLEQRVNRTAMLAAIIGNGSSTGTGSGGIARASSSLALNAIERFRRCSICSSRIKVSFRSLDIERCSTKLEDPCAALEDPAGITP